MGKNIVYWIVEEDTETRQLTRYKSNVPMIACPDGTICELHVNDNRELEIKVKGSETVISKTILI